MRLKTVLAVLMLALLGADSAGADGSGGVQAGVPLSLARERAAAVSDVRYELTVYIRPERTADCVAGVSFNLAEVGGALLLDFAGESVGRVLSGGDTVAFGFENEHVVIPPEHLKRGTNEFTIQCRSSTSPLHWEADHLYSLFVPSRAREVFPCFDQPDLKARFSLSVVLPNEWTAVSNAPVQRIEIPMDGERGMGDGYTVIFAETAPLATYHFAFAAGAFRAEEAKRGGRVMTLYHLEADSPKVSRNIDAIFDLHAEAIRWMEEYTGIPYPFEKFDFVALPVFPYSGMEHPGAIFYRAERLLLDESATEMERMRRASVISHETAHMWFGDLVTMTWFDDVWLKEAFAQFMADRIIRPAFPAVDHRHLFAAAHYDRLYAVERTAGTHPIRQRLDNLNEAGSLYGDIIYHKPPVMLDQLEALMGEEALREGLRRYLGAFRFGNASWEDLIAILDPLSERDLRAWSEAWVMEKGRPRISIERLTDGRGVCRELRIEQKDPLGRGLVWPQRFSLAVADCSGAADRRSSLLVCELYGVSAALSLDNPITVKDFLLPCAGGAGFGYFALDEESVRLLESNPPHFEEPLHRAVYALVLRDNVFEGDLDDVAIYLRILISELGRETVELNIQMLADYLIEAIFRFLPESRRGERATGIEGLLREKMLGATETSVKSTCFKALRSIAATEDGVRYLRDVWERRVEIEGLSLSDRDYAALSCELAVRGVPDWRDILDEQEARFEDEELRRRFQFVRRAASADPQERDDFFASLADVENRRREPWVLEALSYLHHPLRAAQSERYIPPSLELLEEIRATGDIFFPRDWVETTLRYHSSGAAVAAVRTFLEARPDYPERLRLVILQAADPAIRANRIRSAGGK